MTQRVVVSTEFVCDVCFRVVAVEGVGAVPNGWELRRHGGGLSDTHICDRHTRAVDLWSRLPRLARALIEYKS